MHATPLYLGSTLHFSATSSDNAGYVYDSTPTSRPLEEPAITQKQVFLKLTARPIAKTRVCQKPLTPRFHAASVRITFK